MLFVYFADSGHQGRKKIMEEENGDYVRKGGRGRKIGMIAFGS